MDALQLFVSVFITLLVIMDPPGAIPIFLSLTSGFRPEQRAQAAFRAAAVALLVIGIFALFGRWILAYLHISLAAMQGSGGLLLLIVALQLLAGKEAELSAEADVNVALVPLGTPLLAGPGTIVAVMLANQQAIGLAQKSAVGLALLAAVLVVYLTLRYAGGLLRLIKDGGVVLITRISGLLLSAIAVQMIADSVTAFVRG